MADEQLLTLRLREIEKNLHARSIHAVADTEHHLLLILPKSQDTYADAETLWERANNAPLLRFTERELLSDDYLEIALRRASAVLAKAAQAQKAQS